MRPIKFRAWDTKRKKMWSAREMGEDQLTLSPDGRGFVNVHGASTKLSHYMNHLIPLQFTGLKDKNGKEIYEGDIVKLDTPQNPYFPTRNKAIIFNQQFAQFCVDPCTSIMGWKDIEVIGNIHENPELIEEKNA